MRKTLGGDRLGAGKRMQVELHEFQRSTHDLSYIWRSTMSAGTLVPFMSEIGLPGDTFDIHLDADIKTHPTVGPLFGSYKVQLDVFEAPLRLYNAFLHNNKLGVGLQMDKVLLPTVLLSAIKQTTEAQVNYDISNSQINPSSIMAYLGIRGVGRYNTGVLPFQNRSFNAVPWLAYWEIYKNYYANKQEEKGAVIHTDVPPNRTIDVVSNNWNNGAGTSDDIPLYPQANEIMLTGNVFNGFFQFDENIGATFSLDQILDNLIIHLGPDRHDKVPIRSMLANWEVKAAQPAVLYFKTKVKALVWTVYAYSWRNREGATELAPPVVQLFDLADIDTMREKILAHQDLNAPFVVNQEFLDPYQLINWVDLGENGALNVLNSSQEGLAIKTYQSDLFNNWLSKEWIDGSTGINEITAIDTSSGSFTVDTLNLAKKVYDMLNRIAVSGGSYHDWVEAVWAHERYRMAESPIYHGGLSRELVFQEVVSNSAAEDGQPLGTLAGKGVMSDKRKGGTVVIKVSEPSYIIGIISLTPRVDYSQGNKWDVHLKSLNDLHKPNLDEIGFQDLITEQMAWFDTRWQDSSSTWVTKSVGKQPAWVNYMTNVNRVYGNFAIPDNEMFMTLNRRYEMDNTSGLGGIADLTTYIDPVKFNQIFADTAIDAQNFWAQIAVDIEARRIMSAKVMPNL